MTDDTQVLADVMRRFVHHAFGNHVAVGSNIAGQVLILNGRVSVTAEELATIIRVGQED